MKESSCFYHFVLQPWRAGCQAQIHCRASLSRPYSLSPPCPLHQRATVALTWWAGSTQTTDEWSAGSPGPCAKGLRQGLQGAMASHGPSHPPPRHFPPPQNLCSTARVALLFIYWNNYSATIKIRCFFQELWVVACVCNHVALGILWRWMQAGHSSFEVLKSSIKGV